MFDCILTNEILLDWMFEAAKIGAVFMVGLVYGAMHGKRNN